MEKLRFLFVAGILSFAYEGYSEESDDEELLVTDVVGYEEEEEEVALRDRDRDLPSFYDDNRRKLLNKRDRCLRRNGRCYPPPGVLVSPEITVPRPPGRR